jgi:limonene-1,2-epoxide hydrolase
MSAHEDLLERVRSLEGAANRHAVEEVMEMFADDAEFELVGVARLVGKDRITGIFEYDAGVRGEIQLLDCTVSGQTVSGRLVERNDRLRLAGLEQMSYPSCVLSFSGGLIRSWRAVPDPHAMRSFGEFWGAVERWIAAHHPAEHRQLFTDGRFVRSRGNGARIVQLGIEFRSGAPSGAVPGRPADRAGGGPDRD